MLIGCLDYRHWALFFLIRMRHLNFMFFFKNSKNELGKNKKWCLNVKLAQEVDVFIMNYHLGISFWLFRLLLTRTKPRCTASCLVCT